jgi:hypothetical protein
MTARRAPGVQRTGAASGQALARMSFAGQRPSDVVLHSGHHAFITPQTDRCPTRRADERPEASWPTTAAHACSCDPDRALRRPAWKEGQPGRLRSPFQQAHVLHAVTPAFSPPAPQQAVQRGCAPGTASSLAHSQRRTGSLVDPEGLPGHLDHCSIPLDSFHGAHLECTTLYGVSLLTPTVKPSAAVSCSS